MANLGTPPVQLDVFGSFMGFMGEKHGKLTLVEKNQIYFKLGTIAPFAPIVSQAHPEQTNGGLN